MSTKQGNPQLQAPQYPLEQYGILITNDELKELDTILQGTKDEEGFGYKEGKKIETFIYKCRMRRRAEYNQEQQVQQEQIAAEAKAKAEQEPKKESTNGLSIAKEFIDEVAPATPVLEPTP